MSERIDRIRQELEESRQYLYHVLGQVGDRWETPVYSDGLQWNVRQLLAHLADADRGHNAQAMNIAEGKDLIPEDFNIERYNRRTTEKSADKTPQQAISELETTRQQLYDWLSTIDERALDNKGRHATLKIMTVEQILGVLVWHERTHAQDIAVALGIVQKEA